MASTPMDDQGVEDAAIFQRVASRLLRTPVIFDGRNLYNAEAIRALGFTYFSIGRP